MSPSGDVAERRFCGEKMSLREDVAERRCRWQRKDVAERRYNVTERRCRREKMSPTE
jgi:hypothetical protein